ncbi:MAG: MoaD/ThiS family protein [Candidatus Promineifilaceae bacterium]
MIVNVRLLGRFRDRLPAEQKGRGVVEVSAKAIVNDVLIKLGIEKYPLLFAINGQHEVSETTALADGDQLTIFEMAAGG